VDGRGFCTPERSERGKRVQQVLNGLTTKFIGSHYEVEGTTIRKYYREASLQRSERDFAGAMRVAMRTNSDPAVYFLQDHLGSTSITTNSSGTKIAELWYREASLERSGRGKAWGEVRYTSGTTPTKYTYTGQYSNTADFGLMYYGARWYDPVLGRFAQADTIIPRETQGSQAWDRYAYTNNNPVRFTDPAGHWIETFLDIAFIAFDIAMISQEGWTLTNTAALAIDISCALLPVVTGGGPAFRAIVEGGELAFASTNAAVKLPEIIRAGQITEKAIQGVTAFRGETPDTIRDREAHRNYQDALGSKYKYNRRLPSGLKPDTINYENRIVRELKPDNPRAIQRGINQLERYLKELKSNGESWTSYLDLYQKPNPINPYISIIK